MTIKLKCVTLGYKFNDVIYVDKDTITEEEAKALLDEGLAVEIQDSVAEKKVTKSKSKTKK